MTINNQGFEIDSSDFNFYEDGEFVVKILLEDKCYEGCTLLVNGVLELVDDIGFDVSPCPIIKKTSMCTEKGNSWTVYLDPQLFADIWEAVIADFDLAFEKNKVSSFYD